jgi:hypothetical protein
MTLGLRDERTRRRRRFRLAVLKWLVGLGVIAGAGIYAYDQAKELAEQDLLQLKDEKLALQQDLDKLQRAFEALQQNNARKSEQIADWQQRYQQDVPSGDLADLLARMQQRLADGVSPERLAFVINAAQVQTACDNTPTTKRFLVKTPLYSGANDSVGFVDNTITVTASGESATSETGAPEAWYDPARPVTIVFTGLGGEQSQAQGVLPLHHSVVRGANEYRFTAVAGAQGFLNVTGDRCDYP